MILIFLYIIGNRCIKSWTMILVVFWSYLQKKRNIIHTHNSSWVISKKFENKSLDISWVVSNLFWLLIIIRIKLLRQLKIVFPCSGIFSRCFVKSLGLDITSVILTPFQKAATCLLFFVISFYEKIIRTIDYLII